MKFYRMLSVLIVCLLFGFNGIAQKKVLTLDAAVLEGRTTLAPETLSGVTWVGESEEVSYYSEDRKELVIRPVVTKKGQRKVSVGEVNSGCGLSLERFPRITWKNKDVFTFRTKNSFYEYNVSSRAGKELMTIPGDVANVDYNVATNQAAFTIHNYLYYQNANDRYKSVASAEQKDIIAGQAIARYEFGIRKGTFWSEDGSKLAFYSKDESEVADYPLLNINDTPGSLTTIKYPMTGQPSEKPSVGIYDVKTEKRVNINVIGEKDQYLTNLAWGPEGKFIYLAVVNRDQNRMSLNQYDASTGDLVKTLFNEKHDKYVEPEQPVWFIPGRNNEFLWLSERGGFNHAYHYNTEGKLLGIITRGKWEVQEILGLTSSGDNVVVKGTDETGLNSKAYVFPLVPDMSEPNGKVLTKKSGQHRLQLHKNGILLIDQYSSLKTPNVIDIINTKGKNVENLVSALNPLRDYAVGETELIELKANDGTPLHARMIKPSFFREDNKYPVLVYVYGGPHAQMVTNGLNAGARLWMYEMAERGFIVFTLDNRGSKNRGIEFENIIHRQLGKVELEDQLVGYDYLKSLSYVDSDRMAIHGWSYGGYMTCSMMLKYPGKFKAGVAGGPVTDWKWYEAMYGERYMDRPEQNKEGYAEASLIDKTANLEGDLLLIHGTADDVVVMQHNLALVQSFVQNGKQVDFFPYPMHAHNVRGKDRVHLMTKILDYVEDKLGGGVTFGK